MNTYLVKIGLHIGTRKQGENLALRSPDQDPLLSKRCGSSVTSLHTPGLHLGWQGMGRQHDGDPRLSRLPREPIDRVTGPLARFLRIETAGGAVLLVCTATALALSNSSWAHSFFAFWEMPVGLRLGPFALLHSARDWINDGLMTLFFFVVALERFPIR